MLITEICFFYNVHCGLNSQMPRKRSTLSGDVQMRAFVSYLMPSLFVVSTFGIYRDFQKS